MERTELYKRRKFGRYFSANDVKLAVVVLKEPPRGSFLFLMNLDIKICIFGLFVVEYKFC